VHRYGEWSAVRYDSRDKSALHIRLVGAFRARPCSPYSARFTGMATQGNGVELKTASWVVRNIYDSDEVASWTYI